MTDRRWLIIRLEAPLAAFGGVTIDQVGVTRDFPAASMLTGLIGNALGWHRADGTLHQSLQDRLIFAARLEHEGELELLTDTQNAKLEKNDRGWTTWGKPEGRDGASYDAPHRRRRDYHVDACVSVALSVGAADASPSLEDIALALDRPKRPLFIGRKPCLPSTRLLQGKAAAPTAFDALKDLQTRSRLRALWPLGEGPEDGASVSRIFELQDLRNWKTGLHGGSRRVVEGFIEPRLAAA
jgi:CRISPR system Cascade subunit CasD